MLGRESIADRYDPAPAGIGEHAAEAVVARDAAEDAAAAVEIDQPRQSRGAAVLGRIDANGDRATRPGQLTIFNDVNRDAVDAHHRGEALEIFAHLFRRRA